MKGILTTVLLFSAILLSGISIFQIQYTSASGRDNTYPSVYVGKDVTVEGIVTATGYDKGGFFISEPAGGPWRSIYIKSESTSIKTGDKVIVKGTVAELFGMTCIQEISKITIVDSRHPVPFAMQVTTGQISTPEQAESYEGALVKLHNTTCIQNQYNASSFSVSDGSNPCVVRSNLMNDKMKQYKTGDVFATLTGIVCYAFGEYSINPRTASDMAIMVPVFNQNRSWGRIKSIYK